VEDLLFNPVYNALNTRDARFNLGKNGVKYFPEEVSPFAGFETGNDKGFESLHQQLPAGRKILYATPEALNEIPSWKPVVIIHGLQFVYTGKTEPFEISMVPEPLDHSHAEGMVQLAALTKPGPFNLRTIEFGHYHGIFENGRLAAMTGQRLHVGDYTEVSAVCTHPDHLGKGYAATLIKHQLNIIHSHGEKAFLHVRNDNTRAISLYERLGFEVSRNMNFYFLQKEL
jgi:ribosomal protein S18 acetylase RimI-like enzyme